VSLLTEIQAHILTSSSQFRRGSSTGAGTPIWMGRFPPHAPDTAIALFQYGGSSPQYTMSASTSPAPLAFQRPAVQVISRSTNYSSAEDNARAVYDILKDVTNTDLPLNSTSTGTTRYIRILPNQEPFDMGRDGNSREQFSCNYIIEKEPT
jgi:hypothetical protein